MKGRRGVWIKIATLFPMLLCMLASPGPVWPEDAGVASLAGPLEFDPPAFIPGQLVSVYVRLDVGTVRWREETVSSGLPAVPENGPRVLSVSLQERSGAPLLVVRFVAWRPGAGTLPSMSVGGIRAPGLKFSCGSALVDGGTEPPLPMGQLDPPGLFFRLYAIGGLCMVAVLGLALGAAKAVPWFRLLRVRKVFARVRREYNGLLDRLEREGGGEAAWSQLCGGLRLFLARRTGSDWIALTSAEVAALPADLVPGAVLPDAAAILSMGDEARFARRLDVDLGWALRTARSIGDRIDAALEPRPAKKAAS